MNKGNAFPELSTQPQPSPVLKQLDFMVGTWELRGRDHGSGGETLGRLGFEWKCET